MLSQQEIEWKIRTAVLLEVKRKTGKGLVPIGVSNRHVHLSQQDLETLFGRGYELNSIKPLSQPGQFACEEMVTVIGSKRKLEKVRVLGPVRKETQVEISITDSFVIGEKPVIRMSGELDNTPGVELEGPCGRVKVDKGLIVAARHLHISGEEAEVYGLKNGDTIKLKVPGERAIILENILVRSGDAHELEAHLDVDEANAAFIKNGSILEIVP